MFIAFDNHFLRVFHIRSRCFDSLGTGICPVFAVLATDCQLQIVPAVCIGSCKHEGVETPKNISWNIECVRQYFCFGAQASPQTSEGKKHNNVGLLYFKSSPPRPNLAIVSSISSGTIRGIYFPTLYFSILPGMYSGLLSAIHFGIYFRIHSGCFFPFSLTSYCGILLAF